MWLALATYLAKCERSIYDSRAGSIIQCQYDGKEESRERRGYIYWILGDQLTVSLTSLLVVDADGRPHPSDRTFLAATGSQMEKRVWLWWMSYPPF
jgi:hypothetical protein